MKFDCKEISISDEELGCQVTFSEIPDLGAATENMSLKEIEESIGKYLLFQRFFPEEDFDSDELYFETNDENLCGDIEDFKITLSRHSVKLRLDSETIDVSINPTDDEFSDLKRVLPIIINNHGELIIKD
ncbi:MAG TPA: hypothetical protein VMV77_20125 [Bacteroidales bacterium]|nr:hypothetical protein [Bacteroidales bacterium]